jgi:hypothetical protein
MKSIVVTYHEADESRIMAFLKSLKSISLSKLVPVVEEDISMPPTHEERMQGLAAGIMEINADIRGEKEMKSLDQLIKEVKEMNYAD